MEVRAVESQRWLEEIDPDGKIREWSEQDFSKLPLPSAAEQERLLASFDGEEE